MTETIYDQLGAALNARNMNLPAIKCDAYYALVEFLFTPEEAAVICSMPIACASLEEVATGLGTDDLGKLASTLETMGVALEASAELRLRRALTSMMR